MFKAVQGSPVAVGGIGGSGTRVVAGLVSKMGVFIGSNLNASNDNLSFPNLLEVIDPSNQSDTKKRVLARTALENFKLESIRQCAGNPACKRGWGWKVPGTFIWLETLQHQFPDMLYIHVIRHGLDMALSSNKNQLRNWGTFFSINTSSSSETQAALEYWIKANQFAIKYGKNTLKARFLLLNFDQLCAFPEQEIGRLSGFLGIRPSEAQQRELLEAVQPPKTLGRYRSIDFKHLFAPDKISAVRDLGFDI